MSNTPNPCTTFNLSSEPIGFFFSIEKKKTNSFYFILLVWRNQYLFFFENEPILVTGQEKSGPIFLKINKNEWEKEIKKKKKKRESGNEGSLNAHKSVKKWRTPMVGFMILWIKILKTRAHLQREIKKGGQGQTLQLVLDSRHTPKQSLDFVSFTLNLSNPFQGIPSTYTHWLFVQ